MASFQKRGKTYQYTVSHTVSGIQKLYRKGGFRTKKEAQIAATKLEAKLAIGITPSTQNVAFSDYFSNWFKLYKKSRISSVTLAHYEYSLKAICNYFQFKPIQDINRQDYQMFLNQLGEGKAKETVAKIHGHIRACILDAIEDQIIRIDFTRKTDLHWTVLAKTSSQKHLSYKEFKMLISEIRKNLDRGLGYSLLLLAINTGMRFEEIIGLTRKDFNFSHNTINIVKTWGYKKESPEGFGLTKNKQSVRKIHVDEVTMKHFKELFKELPTNLNQLIFYSPTSKYKVISNTNANKLLKRLLLKLNIKPITLHGLRHTHGSVLLYKKASIYYVSEKLGHSNIETTNRVYSHLLEELRVEDRQLSLKVFKEVMNE